VASKTKCRVPPKGGVSRWRSTHQHSFRPRSMLRNWIGWATRSPSCRRTSTRPPRACFIRNFDARHGWSNGFRSCAAWLSWRVGLDLGAAREKVRVAHALGTLPRLAQALANGELSYSKVRALTRVATPETEERLLAVGRAGTTEHVERIVRGWRRVDRNAENQEAARLHKSRAVYVYPDEDGMFVVRGRLTPEVGTLLLRALEAGRETVYQQVHVADRPSIGQQQADALALLAETALHRLDPGAPGARYQVVVHVRRRSAGGSGSAGPVRPRGRCARSS
jgi:uncharacterized protein DUF222